MIEKQLEGIYKQARENSKKLGVLQMKIEKLLESQERLYTAHEAATFLRMSYTRFIQMYKDEIPYIQRNKKLLFRLNDLTQWMEKNSHHPIS